jgi:hypothetical protein
MKTKKRLQLWTVVSVHSGIPCGIKHFVDEREAIKYSKRIRSQIDESKDEVGLFESTVYCPSK